MYLPRPQRACCHHFLIGAIFITSQISFAQRQLFSTADIWQWRTASDVRISADGSRVVYVEHSANRTGDAWQSNLHLATADGREDRELTPGAGRNFSPRWNAAGDRIAYLSNRSGRVQIWVRNMGSGKETPLAEVRQEPLAITWSPKGDAIGFTAPAPAEAAPAWVPAPLAGQLRPRTARMSHIYVANVAGGAARELAAAGLNWTGEPEWAADGQNIVCAAEPAVDPQHPLSGGEIFAVRPSDGAVRQLTHHNGPDEGPVPSPDGSRIAWIAREPAAQSYSLNRLYVMNADGSRDKLLTGAMDRSVGHVQWSSDSRTVYFLSEDSGGAQLYAARNDGTTRQVTKGPERITDFSLADNGRVAAVESSATEAADIVTFMIDLPQGKHSIGSPNGHLLAQRQIGAAEEIHYQSDGRDIQAWLVKPPDFDNSRKYPLLVLAADAPRVMYGYDINLEAQVFAAAGFVTLLANPRGTPGYGEQFGNLLRTRYPGDDADDLLKGVAAAAKPYVDGKRVSVVGGLTAAWLIGHSERFASAVLVHPVADWLAEMAESPEPFRRAMRLMGGMPWDDPEQYWKHSPAYWAQGFRTPTLLIGDDTQSDELYLGLEARKVDAAQLRMKQTGKPGEVAAEWQAALAWLTRGK